jgi:hypothetical protein
MQNAVRPQDAPGGQQVSVQTSDRLSRACITLVGLGILFAMAGDATAGMYATGAGSVCGLAACWADPTIGPWL